MNDMLERELRTLQSTTPEQRAAMLESGVTEERLRELELRRATEEARLQGQMGRAYDLMSTPLQPHSTSPQGLALNTLANALRGVGGLYLANRGEGQMADAKTAATKEHDALLERLKAGRGAFLDAKKGGLSDALREYGSYDGSY